MTPHRLQLLLGVALMTSALAVGGCQSTEKQASAAGGDEAVICPKCQTTWVKRPATVGPPRGTNTPIAYRTKAEMACPECDSAVANFFATGKFVHTCKMCGDNPAHCTVHTTTLKGPVASEAEQVVTCAKCETTWVKRPETIGPARGTNTVTIYRSTRKMTCPDCQSAVDNFFKTGQLEHACKTCGGEIQQCAVHGG